VGLLRGSYWRIHERPRGKEPIEEGVGKYEEDMKAKLATMKMRESANREESVEDGFISPTN